MSITYINAKILANRGNTNEVSDSRSVITFGTSVTGNLCVAIDSAANLKRSQVKGALMEILQIIEGSALVSNG